MTAPRRRPVSTDPSTWPPSVAGLPVCPHRQLPIPFINEIGPGGVGEFRVFGQEQAEACIRHRLCAMCGQPMGAEVALVGDEMALAADGGWFIEPPVHEQCGLDAISGMCPYLSSAKVPRHDHSGDPTVALAAGWTAETLRDVGRGTAKRPIVMAICRAYRPGLYPSQGGGAVTIYQAGPLVRVRRFEYGPDGWLAEVTPGRPAAPARPGVRVVRAQPRRRKNRRG